MKHLRSSAVAALILCHAHSVRADEITLVAPGGIRAAIMQMIPDFERKTGHKVKATFGSGGGTKQQVISEPGVEVVGPLPQEISTPTSLTGFLSSRARAPEAARALLNYLSSSDAAVAYRAWGMQPAVHPAAKP